CGSSWRKRRLPAVASGTLSQSRTESIGPPPRAALLHPQRLAPITRQTEPLILESSRDDVGIDLRVGHLFPQSLAQPLCKTFALLFVSPRIVERFPHCRCVQREVVEQLCQVGTNTCHRTEVSQKERGW